MGGIALERQVKPTSAELGQLWTAYMNASMSIRVHGYFLSNLEDTDIRTIAEDVLQLFQRHIHRLTSIFQDENFPIPIGFTDSDVNLSAPRLFSDSFYLFYLNQMAMSAMAASSSALSSSTRHDIREFFTTSVYEYVSLHNRSTELLLAKGLHTRPPFIPIPDKVDFINNQSFLTGFFGERRPLNSIEITQVFMNMQRNTLGKALLIGFSQVAQSKKVRQYMERGKDIAAKHVKIFSDLLLQDDLPAPMIYDSDVTDSTTQTFSDRLMMFHVAALTAVGIGNYGISLGVIARRDLAPVYTRLIAEVGFYAEDGANISIGQGWTEEPPAAPNRKELARQR